MLFRVKLVLVLFALVGAGAVALKVKRYDVKTEAWMEAAVPEQIPGYRFATSTKQNVAIRMDPSTYEILQPYGIVIRRYQDSEGRLLDFTVVAGNSRKSFHDPQVCFTAQNWELINPRLRRVNIPALGGEIPATIMGLKQQKSDERAAAVYFYKDPVGWRHSPLFVPIDLTFAKLLFWDTVDAQFFRFMVQPATQPTADTPAAKEAALNKDIAEIVKFANAMFSEMKKTPDGQYFVRNK